MALGHGCANTAPSAQWQNLELIFRRLLHRGNKCERREGVAHASLRPAETFMRAYLRPTEAAFFRVRKCANNHQLIVASVERFLRHAYTACSVSYRHANCRVHYVYIRKHWLAYFLYMETVTRMHLTHYTLHEDEICFTSMDFCVWPVCHLRNSSANRNFSRGLYSVYHRISIQQEGKRGGRGLYFLQIEPNWPLP